MTDAETEGLTLAADFPAADREAWRKLAEAALKGAPFDKVPFLDNTPVLELLSAKKPQLGVLILLDEEVRTPQGSDAKWLAKISERHGANPVFGSGSGAGCNGFSFLIRHYAGTRSRRASDAGRRTTRARTAPQRTPPHPSTGDVPYDTRGFVEKNADKLSRNLYALLAGAAEGRTRALFPPKSDAEAGKKASTVAEKFRGQLTKLMTTVERTRPFFIRCIKPNQQKLPAGTAGSLQMKMTIEQLTYAGVFEAVKIQKMGCGTRLGTTAPPHAHSPTALTPHLPRQLPVPPRAPRVRRHLPVDRAQGERLGADPGAPAGGAACRSCLRRPASCWGWSRC